MATPANAGVAQAAPVGADGPSGALLQPEAPLADGDTRGDRAGGEGRSGSFPSLVAAEAGASRAAGGSGAGNAAGGSFNGAAGPAQQVADAVRQGFARGSVDVALHPEELGRVRLSFSPAEAGLTVTIQADRPDTLDLLRRHADLLGNDLRQQGFGTISFEFGAQGGRDGRGADTRGPAPSSAETAGPDGPVQHDPVSPAIPTLETAHSGGLDLRL
ncbi:flagellar hook-length control protein FliK [Rhodovulum sp. 12E13]|uniref:flagellar hook-length control protein FliK n=1 Tax=Rhodovulum sp. 12E13 TaxID=2203891 RepID=UPI001313DB59|nr:flagellar hook-length control protein FliK [Rhodovulum sp. 12E13]